MKYLIGCLGLMTLALGCSDKPDSSKTTPTDTVTYQGSLRALIETNCLQCHQAGGVGPFELNTYADLVATAPAVVAAVTTGSMPPWMPDPECRHYREERLLTAEQVDLFRQWMAGGMREGDASEYQPPGEKQSSLTLLETLGPPDANLSAAAPYKPNVERPDDYRCFVLDYTFDQEMFMTASNIVPDKKELVHHVIVYLISPQDAAQVEARDTADTGTGYTCFGGAGVGSPTPIVGWVPGNVPTVLSEEALIRIPAGAKLVMQVHYNTLSAPSAEDQTEAHLWLTANRPEFLLSPVFFPHLGIDIDAGDANSTHTREFVNRSDAPWTIVSTSPHMHLLGRRLKTVKVQQDGAEECVIDVPAWDFNWQQGYAFLPGEEVTVMPGEKLRLECTYDNSAANQPVVNGEQLQPTQVRWGEGTLDEMCLNTLVFVEPYFPFEGTNQDVCEGFQSCYDSCKSPAFPMTGCILRCGGGNGCANCLLTGTIQCTSTSCGPVAQPMLDCFDSCNDSADPATCIGSDCSGSILAYDACSRPLIEAGQCADEVAACGVTL